MKEKTERKKKTERVEGRKRGEMKKRQRKQRHCEDVEGGKGVKTRPGLCFRFLQAVENGFQVVPMFHSFFLSLSLSPPEQ